MNIFYTIQDAIKMIPLIRSYSKSIRRYYSLYIKMQKAEMLLKKYKGEKWGQAQSKLRWLYEVSKIKRLRFLQWKAELGALSISIGDIRHGFLHIPISDGYLSKRVICVGEERGPYVHLVQQDCSKRHIMHK